MLVSIINPILIMVFHLKYGIKKKNIIKIILLEQKEILDSQKALIKDLKQLSVRQKKQENLNNIIKYVSITFLFTRILVFITNYF